MTDRPRKPHKEKARFLRGPGQKFEKRKPHINRASPRQDRTERDDGAIVLYGWHTVTAALRNPARGFRRLLLTDNAAHRLGDDGVALPIAPEMVKPGDIDRLVGADAVHQGLYAEVDALDPHDLDDLPTDGIVLVLDQITDPHNVGAIMRSAAAFAVTAIVTTNRHSPEATGVLAKSASGALEMVPFVTVQNLARALTALKDRGFLAVGLDSDGAQDLSTVALQNPLALVLGAEGRGLRQLTRDTCSVVARLDMPGAIKSLNVSNAAALALYIGASRLGLMTTSRDSKTPARG